MKIPRHSLQAKIDLPPCELILFPCKIQKPHRLFLSENPLGICFDFPLFITLRKLVP